MYYNTMLNVHVQRKDINMVLFICCNAHRINYSHAQKPIITFLNHSMMVMTLIDGAYQLWFGVQLGFRQGHLSYEDIMKCYALPISSMHMTKLLWKVDSKFHGIFVIGTNPNGNETWFAYRYSLHSSRYFFTLHNIIFFFFSSMERN